MGLTSEKQVGEKVGLRLHRLNAKVVNGVITEVTLEEGIRFYRIDWEDGEYCGEWWDATELCEPHEILENVTADKS